MSDTSFDYIIIGARHGGLPAGQPAERRTTTKRVLLIEAGRQVMTTTGFTFRLVTSIALATRAQTGFTARSPMPA
jgi:hypothetical protein